MGGGGNGEEGTHGAKPPRSGFAFARRTCYNDAMKNTAREICRNLQRLFRDKTEKSAKAAAPNGPAVHMDDETRKAFDSVEASILSMIRQAFDPAVLHALPEDGPMDDLRIALSFRPFVAYEAWHVREDASEKEILAAAAAVRAGRVEKLESLRDQCRKLDFLMVADENPARYVRLLNNLAYLFYVWAHQAKRFGSFAAAKCFLRALSLVNVRKAQVAPSFSEVDVETLVEYVSEGAAELALAADYHALRDWESFRREESAKLDAVLKKKGGK